MRIANRKRYIQSCIFLCNSFLSYYIRKTFQDKKKLVSNDRQILNPLAANRVGQTLTPREVETGALTSQKANEKCEEASSIAQHVDGARGYPAVAPAMAPVIAPEGNKPA